MPKHFFLFKEESPIDSVKLLKAFKSKEYDIDKEEFQLNKLKSLIEMDDSYNANKLCKTIGLYAINNRREKSESSKES